MKTRITLTATVAAAVIAAFSTPAIAGTVYFEQSALNEGVHFTGGEFIANLSNGTTYRSFCLEVGEELALGDLGEFNYNYEITADGARNGGVSGGNPDPVSSAAASIFVAWLNGSIDQTPENSTAVQRSIWAIEGEVDPGSLDGLALALYEDAVANHSTTDNAPVDNEMFSNIRVLNPYREIDGEIFHYQSQIILIPLPAASGLALVGLAAVGARRRR